MTLKMAILGKALLTIVTLIWLLFGVSSDVYCKIAFASKFLVAMVTLIRFFFGVSSYVSIKIASSAKDLLAIVTLIRFLFLFSVSSDDVMSKIATVSKAFLT